MTLRALPPLPGRGAGLVLRSQTFSISQQIALLSLWERVDYPSNAVSQSLVLLCHRVHLLPAAQLGGFLRILPPLVGAGLLTDSESHTFAEGQ